MSGSYDVGIQTVIGKELQAIQKQFEIDNDKDRIAYNGDWYWFKTLERKPKPPLKIVVYCQAKPGNNAASNAASKCIERFKPHLLILSGIAAGRRGKTKIGDVAIPNVVADLTKKVEEQNKTKQRPEIPPLPHVIQQFLISFRLDESSWHNAFNTLVEKIPQPPPGKESEYAKHVSTKPKVHQVAIASDNILIRNSKRLPNLADTIHQQMHIGEMEAAGFVEACTSRHPSVPWLVVRGVSDFGDKLKNDDFHWLASCAAASYVYQFVFHAVDLEIFGDKKKS